MGTRLPRPKTRGTLATLVAVAVCLAASHAMGRESRGPGLPEFANLDQATERGALDPELRGRLDRRTASTGFLVLDHRPILGDARGMTPERVRSRTAPAYAAQKRRVLDRLDSHVRVLLDYESMGVLFVRFPSSASVLAALNDPEVVGIGADGESEPATAQSLPLIGQPRVARWGDTGGPGVAVLDTGIDFTQAAFGACTAPGVPAGRCRVMFARDFAPNDNNRDDNGHGTHMGGIVTGVAPLSMLLSLDVFRQTANGIQARDSDVLAAIDFVLQNGARWNTRVLNISIGRRDRFETRTCGGTEEVPNPFQAAFAQARAQRIVPVVGAGNDAMNGGAFNDGVTYPACTPGAIRVGAVYDGNSGQQAFAPDCTDAATAADQVTCFSQTGALLSLFAPGCSIVAVGITQCGTSQATAHVSGAVSILFSPFVAPAATATDIERVLTNTGPLVTDLRNAVKRNRLSLPHAILDLRPVQRNDSFGSPQVISGATGGLLHRSSGATKEAGEPAHAGNGGGASLWYTWTAPSDGRVEFETRGSSFDTLLAAYTGNTVAGLTEVVSNDDAGGVVDGTSRIAFRAVAGATYIVAVDGRGGLDGLVRLRWDMVPLVTIVASGGLIDPVTATFSEPVRRVTAANFEVVPNGSSTAIGGSIRCSDPGGAPVSCTRDAFTTAVFTPDPHLTPGRRYTATIDRTGATPVIDAGGNPVPTTSLTFRASPWEEEGSVAATYRWQRVRTGPPTSGSYQRDHLPGASVSFRARASGSGAVSWLTVTGPDQGWADVSVDGTLLASVDQYAPTTTFGVRRTVAFSGLAPGWHRFEVAVSSRPPTGTGMYLAVDDLRLADTIEPPATVRYGWQPVVLDRDAISFVRSDLPNSRASFTFFGREVTWWTTQGPGEGQARVSIDGGPDVVVDNYAQAPANRVPVTFSGLAGSLHTITITVAGTGNPASTGTFVSIDAWSVR